MGGVILKVMNEIQSLLAKYKRLDNDFVFIRYSNSHEMFRVNIARKSYERVNSIKDKGKKSEGNIQKLFTENLGGGTNFSDQLVHTCKQVMGAGYHLFIISDTDILYGSNLQNVLEVTKDAKAGVIFDSKESYTAGIKAIGARNNITYLS
jgi:superoxide dismutase